MPSQSLGLASGLEFDRFPFLLLKDPQKILAELRELSETQRDNLLSSTAFSEHWTHVGALLIQEFSYPLHKVRDICKGVLPQALLGSMSRDKGFYHSFLWYARWSILDYSAMKADGRVLDAELKDMAIFCLSAVQGLLAGESLLQGHWEICTQMAYEVMFFYWVAEDIKKIEKPLGLLTKLLHEHSLDPAQSRWMDFDLQTVRNIEAVVRMALAQTQDPLFDIITRKQWSHPDLLDHLMLDFVDQKVSLDMKRTLLMACVREHHVNVDVIALLNAASLSITLLREPRGGGLAATIRNEMKPIKSEKILMILKTIQMQVPIDIVDDWVALWQVIVFGNLLEERIDYTSFHSHEFMVSFFEQHPSLVYARSRETPADEMDRGADYASNPIAQQVFLRLLLFTGIKKGDEKYVDQLGTLATLYGPLCAKRFVTIAQDAYNNHMPMSALKLVGFAEASMARGGIPDPAIQNDIANTQRVAVIAELLERIHSLGPDKNAEALLFISQFLTNDELATPPTLQIFADIVTMMMARSQFDAVLDFTTKCYGNINPVSPELAEALSLLGRCVVLIGQVGNLLVDRNVLEKQTGSFNLEELDNLPAEEVSQYCLFGAQLGHWLGDSQSDAIHKPVSDFVVKSMPWTTSFVLGTLGGRVSRQLGKEAGLSTASLGPAAIFSCPLPPQSQHGLTKLPLKIVLDTEVLSPVCISGVLQFLKSICMHDKHANIPYLLLGDVCFALKEYKPALRNYLNALLVATNYWKKQENIQPFFVSHLSKMTTACMICKDYISTCVLLQFGRPVPYDTILPNLKLALPQLMGTLASPISDPPFLNDHSAFYAFFDVQIIEWLLVNVKGKEPLVTQMLLSRLKQKMYQKEKDKEDSTAYLLFARKILVWYLQKLISQICAND
ncbi:hypothetical protein HDV03_004137 [Kappamyces sp. JEL0829]|nr:hypothetical protein HDV03_004137 [Kappamyces sp. JEL0829]